MLLVANLTGKPAVQTDLQPTKLAVTITWDFTTSAPKKPKNWCSSKTTKPEPANRCQTAPSSTSSPAAASSHTASPPDHTASDSDNICASDSDAHLPRQPHQLQSQLRQSSYHHPSQPLLKNNLRPLPTIPNQHNRMARLPDCDCHLRPATDIHRRHYQPQEVWRTLLWRHHGK